MLAAMFLPMSIAYMPTVGLVILRMDWQLKIASFIYRPWRLYILLVSVLPALNCAAIFLFPESPQFDLAREQKEKVLNTLSNMYQINKGKLKEV